MEGCLDLLYMMSNRDRARNPSYSLSVAFHDRVPFYIYCLHTVEEQFRLRFRPVFLCGHMKVTPTMMMMMMMECENISNSDFVRTSVPIVLSIVKCT